MAGWWVGGLIWFGLVTGFACFGVVWRGWVGSRIIEGINCSTQIDKHRSSCPDLATRF